MCLSVSLPHLSLCHTLSPFLNLSLHPSISPSTSPYLSLHLSQHLHLSLHLLIISITGTFCNAITISIQAIVTRLLGSYGKRLDKNQMRFLLNKESSKNPYWLSIAVEELRVFGDFRKVSEKIQQLADGLLE